MEIRPALQRVTEVMADEAQPAERIQTAGAPASELGE